MPIPKFDEIFNPLIIALKELGGSATNEELEEHIAKTLQLTEEEINTIHKGNRTQFSYNLAWAKTYLKLVGFLENSARGVWSLTAEGSKVDVVEKDQIKKKARQIDAYRSKISNDKQAEITASEEETIDEIEEELRWEDELLETLKQMPAASFEKLCQRLLRESGFIQVEVTGKSGDGGIDGKGIIRLADLLSFHVYFQCKRYKGKVSSSEIREFRGSMDSRVDKALFITTGKFTRDAKIEATRNSGFPIDLIDGEILVKKLKELGLGIETKIETIEKVIIKKEWFNTL